MSHHKKDETSKKAPEHEADVEGHNMWISPTVGREVARGRNAEIEREARDRQRAKEAKKDR